MGEKHLFVNAIIIKALFFFLACFITTKINAQSINFITTQNALPQLDERIVKAGNSFNMQILNQKLVSGKRYKLSLTIKGRGIELKSSPDWYPKPIDLNGEPILNLTSYDLAPYFDIENLDFTGYSKEDYVLQGGVPDGSYNVCFQLYDNTSDAFAAVGNKACVVMWAKKEDVPKITNPTRNPTIDQSIPYNFTWIPRHTSGGLIAYDFEIYEENASMSYNDIMLYNSPVLKTTTSTTSYLLNANNNILKRGRKYFCIVKANATLGGTVFKNGGYSEPEYFSYGVEKGSRDAEKSCPLPDGQVFINEISQGCSVEAGYVSTEYIELVVVGQGSEDFVNLEGYIIDDNNHEGVEIGNEPGHIRLGSCFNAVPSGTIILLYNDGDINPLINPSNNNTNGSPGFWQVPFRSSCLIKYEGCPDNEGNENYGCSAGPNVGYWNNYIPMRNERDVLQIRTPSFSQVHTVAWLTTNYEYIASPKTVHFQTLSNNSAFGKTFILSTGTDWNVKSNWAVTDGCLGGNQSSPGLPNSQDNTNLINGIKNGFFSNDFYISCAPLAIPFTSAKVDITGSAPGNHFSISVDGVYRTTTTLSSYTISNLSIGNHSISVIEDETGCEAICNLEILCQVGLPCDDLNNCTENDVINADCQCKGVDLLEVEFEHIPCNDILADVNVNGGFDCCLLQTVFGQFNNGSGCINGCSGWLTMAGSPDSWRPPLSNNPNPANTYSGLAQGMPGSPQGTAFLAAGAWFDGGEGFRSPTFPTIPGQTYSLSFYQAFAGNGPHATFSNRTVVGDSACWTIKINNQNPILSPTVYYQGAGSQTWSLVNLNFVAESSTSTLYFNCKKLGIRNNNQYYVAIDDVKLTDGDVPCSLQDSIIAIVDTVKCEGPYSYLWSNGTTNEGINISDLGDDACYKVTVTCSNGCSYTGTYGDNCGCVVGTPCPGDDSCFYYGTYDSNCNCPSPLPSTDSDGDGICDEIDVCPGEPDEDFDGDGIIDCNDPEVSCNNLTANLEIIPIVPGTCDYVVNLDSLLGNHTTIDINKILLHIDQKNYVIEGSQYNMPICFGNQPAQSFFVNHENFDATGGSAVYFWNGVPNDAKRVKEKAVSQDYSMRLRDNSEYSLITSNQFAVNNFQNVKVEFSFVSAGFEVFNQNFVLEVSYDGGQSYQLVRKWNFDSHFKNDIRKNVSELINLPPGTNFAKLRIRCDATDDDNELFIDNIYVSKLKNSCSKELAKQKLKQAIENWLLANSYSGIVSYMDANQPGDTICPKKGLNLQIDGANIVFDAILGQNSYIATQQSFCTVSCTGPVTGNTAYEVNVVDVNCEQPTYLWSNGSTSDSLIIGSLAATQSVTITCANGCDTILIFGEGYCQVGNACDPPGDCYSEGFLNEHCDCIPSGIMNDSDQDGICDEDDPCPLSDNHIDADGDGNPDCAQDCPPIELYFVYSPNLGNICDLCVDIDNLEFNDLNDVIVSMPLGQIIHLKDLTTDFKFPYCNSITEAECTYGDPFTQAYTVKPSIKKFISHFYAWGIKQSADFSASLKTTNACSGTNAGILIRGSSFIDVQFKFGNVTRIATKVNCRQDTISYNLCLDPQFIPVCDKLTYSWSNGEVSNCVVVSDTLIGEELTIDCNGCTYIGNPPNTNCLVGKPCDDYNVCTTNDHYDANCICIGDLVPDIDGDTVCDSIDVCHGADDLLDSDNDGIPNCLDTCFTVSEVCTFCVDLHPIQITPCYLSQGYSYLNANGNLESVLFTPINVCPSDPNTIAALLVAINQSLQQNNLTGKAVSSGSDCSPFGRSISIINSDLTFVSLYVKGQLGGNNVNSLPFIKKCETVRDKSCDDGNPCTTNDMYDDNCICKGICLDRDDDTVCDACDICPDGPDHIDLNNNSIPDACDINLFECDGTIRTYCEHLIKMKDCSADQNKVFEFDLRVVSQELREFFAGVNFNPTHFNIPQLMENLQGIGTIGDNDGDGDNDGIIDYLDPCPNFPNEFDDQGRIPLDNLMNCCGDVPYEPLRMSLQLNWMFKTVNWIDEEHGIYPTCANELGIPVQLDIDGDMVTEKDCEIEFFVDCNCKCSFKILDDIDNDGICGKLDTFIVINPPCDGLICPDPPDACTFYNIVECVCVPRTYEDSDGDGICDLLDICEGEPDVDSDGDGIMDCVDACNGPVANHHDNPEIPTPSGPGDPCDDGDPCTYADVVGTNCGCEGVMVDVDGDGITDCGECKIFFTNLNVPGSPTIEVSDRGPFEDNCVGCYTIYNADPNKPCDICPDMDDALDYNNNGVPDCIDKPFKEIGCPTGYQILPGVGLVLTFDVEDPDEMKVSDFPSPISFVSSVDQGIGNNIQSFDYIIVDQFRVTSPGQVEVIYPVPDIENGTAFDYVGISFASHQGCLFSSDTTSTDILADVNCPTGLGSDGEGNVLAYYDFGSATPDLLSFQGGTSVTFNTSSGGTANTNFDVLLSNISSSGATTYSVILGQAPSGISPPYSLNSITLQNGIVCTYSNGVVQPCISAMGVAGIPGSPCTPDPAEPCKTHFRLDNNCNCIGDDKPDSDDDGLCDEIDPCPDFPNVNPDGSDCDCPELSLSGDFTITNGSDVSIPFDMTDAAAYSGITITITGGPPGMTPIDTVLSNPLVVGNLPKGYAYTITVTATCGNGGTSSIPIEIPIIPFETNPTFCGIEFKPIKMDGLTLLRSLNKDDVITASDFDVTIREAKGQYGKFTGKGYIKVPYFEQVRINVNFKDIIVSMDKQMIQGHINVNGFGVAILGDPISDVINDGVNTIINTLEDLSDILDELIPVLEAAEELLATTQTLVSPDKKKCVEDAKANLKTLETQAQNPNLTQAQKDALADQIKAATVVLKNCIDAYNAELLLIAGRYLEITKNVYDDFVETKCTQSVYDLFESASPPLSDFTTKLNEMMSNLPPVSPGTSSLSLQYSKKDSISGERTQFFTASSNLFADDYYKKESDYQVCKLLDKLLGKSTGNDQYTSTNDALAIASLYLNASSTVVDDIGKLINEGKTNQQIENDQAIRNALIDALKLGLFYKIYKRQ